jgi:hypothetical protein
MPDPLEDLTFNEALSMLAGSSSDSKILFRVLARDLSETIGERVAVERAGRFGKSANEIVAITINLGSETFQLEQANEGLRCTIGVTSGGIRIKSEHPDVAEWARRLAAALQKQAASSEASRQALERLLIGGSS